MDDKKKKPVDTDNQDEIYALTGNEDDNKPNEFYALTGKNYADGGVVDKDKAKSSDADDEPSPQSLPSRIMDDIRNRDLGVSTTQPSPLDPNHPATGLFIQKRFADGGVAVSDDEKRRVVLQAIKDGSVPMADGGIPTDQPLPPDAPQDSKLQTILQTLGMAGKAGISSVLPGTQALSDKIAPASADVASTPGIAPAINSALGTNLPGPDAPAPTPPVAAPVQPPTPQGITTKALVAAHTPPVAAPPPDPLADLGKFDPSTVTPGLNPADRQNLANQVQKNQHTFGNYLAEAMAGLGDAVAAKGGVKQNALGDIFTMQTQQRQEALDNFDKARQAAVEHFTMKNQADQALINNLKARGELQVAPGIAHALGHPELAGRPVAQAELVLKTDAMKYDFANKMQERKQSALKNAAEDIDKALTHGGMMGTQKMMDPKSRLNMIHAQAIKNDPEAFGYHVTTGHK